jgi:PBP1b-binding outer membrane lipoprotein LpoB
MKKISLIISLLLILTACNNYSKKTEQYISPIRAVELAAIAAPETYSGVFEMTVQAGKSRERMTFLNSELDYRDQRNLTIALRPAAMKQL